LSIGTDAQFRARFAGTALLRPKRRGLLRNAALVARNIDCTAAVPVLIERIENDSEPLIRSHSLWALAGLDQERARQAIGRAISDPDPSVREEARRLAEES
jgi:epoxyqueuosine reductase